MNDWQRLSRQFFGGDSVKSVNSVQSVSVSRAAGKRGVTAQSAQSVECVQSVNVSRGVESGCGPAAWLAGVAALQRGRNPGCHPTAAGWNTFVDDARGFVGSGWAATAAAAGWTAEQLFGVLRRRPDVVNWWGSLLLLQGGTVLEVAPGVIRLEGARRIRQSLRRPDHRRDAGIVPVWAIDPPALTTLTRCAVRELAHWYQDEADHRRAGSVHLDQRALDRDLRSRVARRVSAAIVEAECERVLNRVFEAPREERARR